MDKFKNRIKYYLIGLGFGFALVYFMFGNRGCSWLPSNRVKNMIGEKEIIVGDSILDVMEQLKLTNDDIYLLLKSEGDVDFSLSKTKGVPKIYFISAEKENEVFSAKFALYEEREFSEVIEVKRNKQTAISSQSNQTKSTLPLPHADVIAIIEGNEFRILSQAECQMEFYALTQQEVFNFHTNATIDIAKSKPRLSPNPFYVMYGKLGNREYEITYIIGDNRTRISKIDGKQPTNCPTN